MSGEDTPTLKWSASFSVPSTSSPSSKRIKLSGDKILLPPSALEQLLAAAPVSESLPDAAAPLTSAFDPFNPYTYAAERHARESLLERQQQLPHPLTFRLVNPANGRVVYAGIREFSAGEDEVVLSSWLRLALGFKDEDDTLEEENGIKDTEMSDGADVSRNPQKTGETITVHARQLPKGTFVKLRPLEAGYDAEDWKALLEQHLRTNFTTLTNGEVLDVPGGRGIGSSSEHFRFLVDGFQPEGDGICIVDTDLEVDIEALNEEQAIETVKRLAEKAHRAPGTTNGSSSGGRIDLFQSEQGQVLPGDWVDYSLPSWDRSQGVEIELSGVEDNQDVQLYVSPLAPRQRAKPREDEYIFAELDGRYPKRIRINPTNAELEGAEAIQIAIHAFSESDKTTLPAIGFTISVNPFDPSKEQSSTSTNSDTPPNPGEARCDNCHQWIPERTMTLHQNFCYRNNILCPQGCDQVFQKRSPQWTAHWHCPHDRAYGSTPQSRLAHDTHFHTTTTCTHCTLSFSSIAALAGHRTSVCPAKLILCQFCHLTVPQDGDPLHPDPAALLANLTPHELADGARTTECHLCSKIVRLRDMPTHLAHHELSKTRRAAPIPCRNALCGRSVHGADISGNTRLTTSSNELGLCSRCFGPLYVALHDPDGRALKRRVERRYLAQLLTGCGKDWCRNSLCRAGRKNLGMPEQGTSARDALPMIKPELVGLEGGAALHFCVDERAQESRVLAEHVAAEGVYAVEWCVGALEASAGNVVKGREWLGNWAPKIVNE
ncbi:putative ubiquitin fusion degradation protein [Microthyrium microscopicum]|uniref:Putative ubiquitin fusion degradation protein n=1 Tax=Microthyrium microscopicum TaxID=703497 RepID=A0A6A6U099_9PEZI|nr:putative ubiquitin fusion degradation protein [Microthyrium microscopicum]